MDRLAEHGGCARRSSIARGPRELAELRGLVACGAVQRQVRGLYAIPGTRSDVLAARRVSGLLTCASAAARLGLPLLTSPSAVHLALPGHRAVPRAGLVPAGSTLHWDSEVALSAASEPGLLAPLPTALAHALKCLPAREAIALADAALNRRLIELPELTAKRPRTGIVDFDRLLRAVDGRSQSLPETFARLALTRSGLSVEPQVEILGVGWVDLLVEELVVVELDGYAFHSDRAQFREDRRRDRVLHLIGIPCLRYTYDDAVHDSDRLVLEVAGVVRSCRRAGATPIDRSLRRGPRDS